MKCSSFLILQKYLKKEEKIYRRDEREQSKYSYICDEIYGTNRKANSRRTGVPAMFRHGRAPATKPLARMYYISINLSNKMKKSIVIILFLVVTFATKAQQPLTLDSCRHMALRNNTQLRVAEARIQAAHYNRKAAFTAYLPGIDATGGYMYSSRQISLLNENLQQSLPQLGTALTQSLAQAAATNPALAGILAALGGIDLAAPLNQMGQTVVDEFHTDTRNMFGGIITLTQPIYMGGKIRAYNKITRYAEELAKSQQSTAAQELVYQIDELYWQVVSLTYKKQLAESYALLLDSLNYNVQAMIEAGVATRSDGLSVAVKANEAQITLTQVNDGVSLAKMVLAQMCGMPVDAEYRLYDEIASPDEILTPQQPEPVDMESVYARRSEIQSLAFAEKIYRNKQKAVMSGMLPTLAVTGSYMISNPSLFNGFEREFKGMFNVGVILRIPLLHWGENIYKYRAAKTDSYIARLNMEEAKEKIELQVNQAAFKANEAYKRLDMTMHNLESADENLRNAQTGFGEGVLTTSNILEAQTAWLKAQSEYIDARIGVKLCDAYLGKAIGTLQY